MPLVDVLDMLDLLNTNTWFGVKGWAYDMSTQVFYLPVREGRVATRGRQPGCFDSLVCAQPLSVATSAYMHLQRMRQEQEAARAASGMKEGSEE